jgi:hypothetical protein
MRFNHAPGRSLQGFAAVTDEMQSHYHDPVYDESGGQGTAVVPVDPGTPANPGVLLMVALVILVVMMMGDD